jgi:hypothetical protein
MSFNPQLSPNNLIPTPQSHPTYLKTTYGVTSFAIPCEMLKQKVCAGTIMIRSTFTFDKLCLNITAMVAHHTASLVVLVIL